MTPATYDREARSETYGQGMLLIFTTAALIVTGAIVALAVVGSWWMLAGMFAVHVVVTTFMTMAVIRTLDNRAAQAADPLVA